MRIDGLECDSNNKLIRGYVHDEAGKPICGAVIILEKIECDVWGKEISKSESFISYSLTNARGEFCLSICGIPVYYKVKIFVN